MNTATQMYKAITRTRSLTPTERILLLKTVTHTLELLTIETEVRAKWMRTVYPLLPFEKGEKD